MTGSVSADIIVNKHVYDENTNQYVEDVTYTGDSVPLNGTKWKVKEFPVTYKVGETGTQEVDISFRLGFAEVFDSGGNLIDSFKARYFAKKFDNYWFFQHKQGISYAFKVIDTAPEDYEMVIIRNGEAERTTGLIKIK
tara:strand:- start:5989 stop:6402 length:414 start_codon:yes stop_codon:yes gene_type:complete